MLFCCTSDAMLKVWCIEQKKCLHTVRIGSLYNFPLQIYQTNEFHNVVIHSGRMKRADRIDENPLRLRNLEIGPFFCLSSNTDCIALMKVFTKRNNEPILATSGKDDFSIKIWDVSNKPSEATLSGQLVGHDDIVSAAELFFVEYKVYLASASKDNTIKLWDLSSFSIKNTFKVESNIYDLISIKLNKIIKL